MKRISSASTLIFKVFFPVFWFIFFGCLSLGLFIIDDQEIEFSFMGKLKWIFLFFFLIFSAVIFRTLIRLQRVDADSEFIYISNYLKTIRISYDQIESLNSKSLSIRLLGRIQLKQSGRFGSTIYFICEADRYDALDHFYKNAIQY